LAPIVAGQAPADAAAAQAEIALWIVARDELAHAGRRGQRLLDHDRVLRQGLADGIEQRQRLHRRQACERARLGLERLALARNRAAGVG